MQYIMVENEAQHATFDMSEGQLIDIFTTPFSALDYEIQGFLFAL